MLGQGGNFCRQSRIDHRQSIFVAKQIDRILRDVKTLDLGLPRAPKHGGRKDAGRK